MTKELVLISHGKMAEEVKKSAELIMGPQEHIHVVCLLPEEGPEDFEKKFQATINGIPEVAFNVFSFIKSLIAIVTLSFIMFFK